MATKKRKEDEDIGLDKKRRKSGVAANGAELHGAASAAEEQQPIVSFIDWLWSYDTTPEIWNSNKSCK